MNILDKQLPEALAGYFSPPPPPSWMGHTARFAFQCPLGFSLDVAAGAPAPAVPRGLRERKP